MEKHNVKDEPNWHEIAREYVCHECGAGPGEKCITKNLKPKFEVHADRSHQAAANGWKIP